MSNVEFAVPRYLVNLRAAGKEHLISRHLKAADTVTWWLFGRRLGYPAGDVLASMVLKPYKRLWI